MFVLEMTWTMRVLCLMHVLACVCASPLVIDPVKFLRPDDFDVVLTDMAESDLHLMAELEGVGYLNVSKQEPVFPVLGLIMGAHRRLMVNLLVRRRAVPEHEYRNVVFMVDTGSPYTFLSRAAMSALVGPGKNVPRMMRLEIHGNPQSLVCYLSPPDKHFAEINLLGMDWLEMMRVQLDVDWLQKTFLVRAGICTRGLEINSC